MVEHNFPLGREHYSSESLEGYLQGALGEYLR